MGNRQVGREIGEPAEESKLANRSEPAGGSELADHKERHPARFSNEGQLPDAWSEVQREVVAVDGPIEAVVFGNWFGDNEPVPPPVPPEKRGVRLSAAEAEPMMRGWKMDNVGDGSGDSSMHFYPTYLWTRQHVWFISRNKSSTVLDSVPRNPDLSPVDVPGGLY